MPRPLEMTRACAILTLVIVFSTAPSQGCSCAVTHPQHLYCNSDYVIRGIAGERRENAEKYMAYYDFEITSVYKEPENSSLYFTNTTENKTVTTLTTPLYDSLCGTYLAPGVDYVIAGSITSGAPRFGLCGLHQSYDSMTRRQLNGIKHKYKLHCNCKITYCWGPQCDRPAAPDECLQNVAMYTKPCTERHTLCKRSKELGACVWTDNYFNSLCKNQILKAQVSSGNEKNGQVPPPPPPRGLGRKKNVNGRRRVEP